VDIVTIDTGAGAVPVAHPVSVQMTHHGPRLGDKVEFKFEVFGEMTAFLIALWSLSAELWVVACSWLLPSRSGSLHRRAIPAVSAVSAVCAVL